MHAAAMRGAFAASRSHLSIHRNDRGTLACLGDAR
jgi:hypothetical protein